MTDSEVAKLKLEWEDSVSMAVVLAAQGYPGTYQRGIRIEQIDLESKAYYAGVTGSDGGIVSSGGRVLSLVAQAVSIDEVRRIVYRDVERFIGSGLICRKDIGKRDNTLD
ncbi:MAG: hypothetical protein LRZ88_04390 [Candidatus Cloacimonetes bacterium]|nr:hypothetical protein [Candidatus Cloacimonadota bacterium]